MLWDRIAGDENASHIDVEQMESQTTEDVDEIKIYKEIWSEMGISTIRLGYIPENTYLKKYELDKEQKKATLLYDYNGQTIRYIMYMNDEDSSLGQIKTDQLISEYQMEEGEGISVSIKEYKMKDAEKNRYVAEFEYKDSQYQLMASIDYDEFIKIVNNLVFL